MASAKEKCLVKLATVTGVDMKTVASTTLYTVPAGKSFIPDHVVIRNYNASLSGGVCTFGQSGAKTDFLGSQTLTNLSTTTTGAAKLSQIPNATPVQKIAYAAGLNFVIDVTTGITAGSGTATIEVWGYLI